MSDGCPKSPSLTNSASSAEPANSSSAPYLAKKAGDFTLLIVDDDSVLREAIESIFKDIGFNVLGACNGTDAFQQLQINHVDMVISDIQMPNGDGLFLLDKVQSLPKKIPLVFISGYSEFSEADCIERGALKLISKPFSRKTLLGLVFDSLDVRG